MKTMLLIALLAAAAAPLPILRPSNSKQLTRSGIEAYKAGNFEEAAHHFSEADSLSESERATFNAGTAAVAAGALAEGKRLLDLVLEGETPVAGDARFNDGNAELTAEQWDAAIEQYSEVLRRQPSAMDAKRNLEIALQRKTEAEERQDPQSEPQPQPTPSAGEEEQPAPPTTPPPGNEEGREQMTPEEILRSIAQQEREELQRMRRVKGSERRALGW